MIQAYESPTDEQVYVLVDSWYTSKKLVDACKKKGFKLIGAFRMNRKFYPKGKHKKTGIKVSEFASDGVSESDLHSVTVNGRSYDTYRYEGRLSDIKHVKLLLSWDKGKAVGVPSLCILSTDCSLDFVTIQEYYDVRWNIETGYRYFKDLLGFDQYQLLSDKGIERFWAIQFLTYNILEVQRIEWSTPSNPLTIGDVVRRIRQEHLGQLIMFVYEQALAKSIRQNK
jgi:IS4 transposase